MAMLNRYKKSGGFVQLLKLIETFGPQKQEKFMAMIREEDPTWADAIMGKLLSIDRIFSWEANKISEVLARLPEKNFAVAVHGLSEDKKQKVFSQLGHSDLRRLENNLLETKPTEGEISASMEKIIESAREMISAGQLRVEHFDKDLLIEEDIEEKLSSGTHYFKGEQKETGPIPSAKQEAKPSGAAHQATVSADVETLRQKVIQLQNENKNLKHECKVMKEKLEQIKKIA